MFGWLKRKFPVGPTKQSQRDTSNGAKCPYCAGALKKQPQRKMKCPNCGEPIFVKRPFGSPPGTKRLMTASQADVEEAKWSSGAEWKDWVGQLSAVNVSEEELRHEHVRLGAKDNGLTAVHHILSTILGSGVDIHRMKMAAMLMARVASKQGRDPLLYLQLVQRLDLEQMRPNARGVIIRKPAANAYGPDRRIGPQCDRWQGRVFTVDEALSEMPLPCSVDCVCHYRPIFIWEKPDY